MKKTIFALTLGLLINLTAKAEDPIPAPGADFEANKAEALKRIDERIEMLGKLKACASGAAKPEDFKACQKDHKATMSTLRLEMMNARIEKMHKHRDKMDQKIKEFEAKKQEQAQPAN